MEWRDVPGFEGIYWISSSGDVRNGKGQILKAYTHKSGYLHIRLYGRGKPKGARIHRLVAAAFIRAPEDDEQVNHKDFNKANNCVENLEWCTGIENVRHAVVNGRTGAKFINGYVHWGRRFSNADVLTIANRYRAGESPFALARELDVDYGTIKCILAGETYQGAGRVDEFLERPRQQKTADVLIAEVRRLRFSGGMTLRQIASHLGIAKSVVHRACSPGGSHVR